MPTNEASSIRLQRGDDPHRDFLISTYFFDILARASTDEPSGYALGTRSLTMIDIANAITAHFCNDPHNIAFLGAPPGEISKPIVVGTLKTRDDQIMPSFVVSRLWLLGMTREGVANAVDGLVDDGSIDPKEIIQKLYGLMADKIQWDSN